MFTGFLQLPTDCCQMLVQGVRPGVVRGLFGCSPLPVEHQGAPVYSIYRLLTQAARAPQQQRHPSMLSEFLMDVQYLPESHNIMADALSHSPISIVSFSFDFTDLSLCQQNSPEIKAYRSAISGLVLHHVALTPGCPVLLCDLSTSRPCPVVPPVMPVTWCSTCYTGFFTQVSRQCSVW